MFDGKTALELPGGGGEDLMRGADFGSRPHQQGLLEETREKREEIATRLAEAMVRDGISRELYGEILSYLEVPAGIGQARLAQFLKVLEEAFAAAGR